jgi:hypothetical protein
MTRIAILGWGSLLWDRSNRDFEKHHSPWKFDGPWLKLEFSRISKTRLNALTLVIDPVHGEECQVAYALSRRRTVQKATDDLVAREQTTPKNIGCVLVDASRHIGRDATSAQVILQWARTAAIDVVLWTDLPDSFTNVRKGEFVKTAVSHVQGLTAEGKVKAAEYVWRAPEFIITPLRNALQAEPWFKKQLQGGG